ncbi:DOMON-like domain-containing protein [Lyngbya confervoides]|uniref:DOMON-like domain-containing protein n=1 Tax=Lyngbya confervoides BDU141951 TaxID=1574623 RepID=A0ABD4T955_9CYAN|nr:DOMON-like domain-containing protein [Lyngbya confervoides]MCM1985018.1 DOMON-like domain-containing protein [Lyngbya confervoides BDU141951]
MSPYTLIPFETSSFADLDPPPQITATVKRQRSLLRISFELTGAIAALALPQRHPLSQRRHHLWQHSCFECFVRPQAADRYWEVNVSPTGDWNRYAFSSYRAGMTPCPAVTDLPVQIKRTTHHYHLSYAVDLTAIAPPTQPLDLAIATVLETQTGLLSYWALTHPSATADFHHPDSFLGHCPAYPADRA